MEGIMERLQEIAVERKHLKARDEVLRSVQEFYESEIISHNVRAAIEGGSKFFAAHDGAEPYENVSMADLSEDQFLSVRDKVKERAEKDTLMKVT